MHSCGGLTNSSVNLIFYGHYKKKRPYDPTPLISNKINYHPQIQCFQAEYYIVRHGSV